MDKGGVQAGRMEQGCIVDLTRSLKNDKERGSLRLTDGTELFLRGHIDFGTIDRLSRRLFANGIDTPRLIGNIGDIDVDQEETDFVELG